MALTLSIERDKISPMASPFKSYRTTTLHAYLLPLLLAYLWTVVPTRPLCFHTGCKSIEKDWLTSQNTLNTPSDFNSPSSGHSTSPQITPFPCGEVIKNLPACPIPPLKNNCWNPVSQQQAVVWSNKRSYTQTTGKKTCSPAPFVPIYIHPNLPIYTNTGDT